LNLYLMSIEAVPDKPAPPAVKLPKFQQKKIECLAVLSAVFWLSMPTSQAQTTLEDDPNKLVHYSYATLLGTGYYTVGDRKVAILRVPLSHEVREAGGPTKPGIRVKIPVTAGLHNFKFSDIPGLRINDVVTTTIMPGVELNFQLNDRWDVDSSIHIGYGRDLTDKKSALLWGGDVRTRYSFDTEKPELTLGGEAIYSGYHPDDGASDSIVRLALGLDAKIPTGWSIGKRNLFIGTHAITFYYPAKLVFPSIDKDRFKTFAEFEFGVALGGNPAFKILGLEFDRAGLAYRFSDETNAIILTTSFPF